MLVQSDPIIWSATFRFGIVRSALKYHLRTYNILCYMSLHDIVLEMLNKTSIDFLVTMYGYLLTAIFSIIINSQ